MDETSASVGKLLGQMELLIEQGARQADTISELSLRVEQLAQKVEATERLLEDQVLPEVMDYNSLKQRGMGVLATVGSICAVLGVFANHLLETLSKVKS